MNPSLRSILSVTALAAAAASVAQDAQAAGFYIKEQSITGLGRAFAGESAIGEDASTIFFNPAAMTELEGPQGIIGTHLLIPRSELTNEGSTINGAPISGGNGGNPYDPTPVPNLYVAAPAMDGRVWFGLGVSAPFGLANSYDEGWFGRYDSTDTELVTIDIAPSLAVRATDWLSIGGGLDIQYADATLESKIATVPGVLPDGNFKLEGSEVTAGYNIGVLLKPLETTRIGVHYRSAITHSVEGTATFSDFTGPFAGLNGSRAASADLKLPDIFAVGIAHEVSPKLTLLAEYNWYGWSNFNEIRIRFDDGLSNDAATTQDYQDSFSIAVGAQYDVNETWTVRGGFQYDETPTTDAFRSTRTPDGNRYWLSAGATYRLNERFVIDAAYTHIFIEEESINLDFTQPTGNVVNLRAKTEGSVDIVSVALRYNF